MTTKDGLVGNPDHYCVNVNRALLEYLKNLIGSGKNKLKYLQINTKSIIHLGIPVNFKQWSGFRKPYTWGTHTEAT